MATASESEKHESKYNTSASGLGFQDWQFFFA